MLVVPAVNDGLKGSGLEHGAPFGPETTSNVEADVDGSFPDHGAIDAVVVYAPHKPGVDSGARSPPKKCSFKSSNGSWGVFLNVETSCPVTGSGTTSPASFTSVPDIGSRASRYRATRLPNGFAYCAARYASPVNAFGNNGLFISSVATFDASGQLDTESTDSAICASEHACSPSAAAGFKATPAGNVTVVSFTSAGTRPFGFKASSWGTWTPTVKPVGVLAACPSGATLIEGLNGSRLQPSIVGIATKESNNWKLPATGHESASTSVWSGAPTQEVGIASSGGGWSAAVGSHGAF